MKKNLYAIILLLIIISCKKDSINSMSPQPIDNTIINTSDNITLNMALSIAKNYKIAAAINSAPPLKETQSAIKTPPQALKQGTSMTTPVDFSKRAVGQFFAVKSESGDTTMYIINYQQGGFLVLSASKKEHPILAYSDNSSFPEEITTTEHPVNFWISGVTAKIKALKRNLVFNKDSANIKAEWKKYLPFLANNPKTTNNMRLCPGGHLDPETNECATCPDDYEWDGHICQPPPPCQTAYTIGPLISTLWSQDCGFNTYTPGSSNSGLCYHDPAGCEAVAMGQIMKYWHSGFLYFISLNGTSVNGTYGLQTYDYSDYAMPLYSGSLESARLLRDIGSIVGMSYSETSSGANPNHETFFKNAGYSDDVRDYNYNQYDVFTDVTHGWPCMLSGFTYAFWPWDAEGHEWVCDGLSATPKGCYASFWDDYDITLHLNWGWGGYCNGWYAPGYWAPSSYGTEEGHHFFHNLSEVVGIHI